MRRFETALLVVMSLSLGVPAAFAAPTTLSPQAIKTTFGTGLPFQSTSPSGVAYTIVLKPDGTASRTPKATKTPTTGTWRVNDSGYCSKWGKNSENCYTIRQDGPKYTVLDSSAKPVATWLAPAKPAATK